MALYYCDWVYSINLSTSSQNIDTKKWVFTIPLNGSCLIWEYILMALQPSVLSNYVDWPTVQRPKSQQRHGRTDKLLQCILDKTNMILPSVCVPLIVYIPSLLLGPCCDEGPTQFVSQPGSGNCHAHNIWSEQLLGRQANLAKVKWSQADWSSFEFSLLSPSVIQRRKTCSDEAGVEMGKSRLIIIYKNCISLPLLAASSNLSVVKKWSWNSIL